MNALWTFGVQLRTSMVIMTLPRADSPTKADPQPPSGYSLGARPYTGGPYWGGL